ncbi:hypothetical protein PG997_015443 [Apiospora hydei]|uniref:Zn(2)-C6 fungal-type domain-containing protein n=1 Tax=Apiospora hydei TaxID=1337664 RepID=A0ABR1URB5_9PEZI
MSASAVAAGQPPRACDRCHAIKERCDWRRNDGAQCDRCLRLGHCCRTVRQERRPGRRPGVRNHKRAVDRTRQGRCAAEVSVVSGFISTFAEAVSMTDRQLVERFFNQNHLLDTFSVGSSFSPGVRQQVIPRLFLSRETLLDGVLVCALSWADDADASAVGGRLSTCFRHASSALATLASLEVTDLPTMTDCLILGAMLSTFAMRLRLNDVLAICRRTLGLVEPMYATRGSSNDQANPMHSMPGLWGADAALSTPAEAYADRHVGLCATLLPLLYDVCELSHEIGDPLGTASPAAPFGTSDGGAARLLATAILMQLKMTFVATQQHVRCTDLPLLVACLELTGMERAKWLLDIAAFAGFSSEYGDHIRETLVSYWAVLDRSTAISWSDMVQAGAPFSSQSTVMGAQQRLRLQMSGFLSRWRNEVVRWHRRLGRSNCFENRK